MNRKPLMHLSSRIAAGTVLSLMVACSPSPSAKNPASTPSPSKNTPKAEAKTEAKPNKADAEAEKAAPSQTLVELKVDSPSSKVGFIMEAPMENIRGKVPTNATHGQISLDPEKLNSLHGKVQVNIAQLELYQRKAKKSGKYGKETRNDTQNAHARSWLEIDNDAPEDQRKKNQIVEFSVQEIISASAKSLSELSGDTREVTVQARGPFVLHQNTHELSVHLKLVFHMKNDKVHAVDVSTSKPLEISLDTFDVRPRTAFGKLAQKTLSAMSEKVAQVAEVNVEFRAQTISG